MHTIRNRHLALGLTGAATLGFFAAILMGQGAGQPAKAEPPSAAARLAAAERVCKILHDRDDGTPVGHQGIEHTYLWSLRRMEAQRDVEMDKDHGIAAAESHLERMREFAKKIADAHAKGAFSTFEVASTEFYIAEAEELLARARAK